MAAPKKPVVEFRKPKQARGQEKFEKLLDATHELVLERGGGSFNLGDVAKKAGVATSTAYHFFSNIDAAFAALVGRYDRVFANLLEERLANGNYSNWRDFLNRFFEESRLYVNSHPKVMSLLIGPGRTMELRQVRALGHANIVRALEEALGRYWILPGTPPASELLHLAMQMLSGCWELSIHINGRIDRKISAEAERAVYSYLRSYWAEDLEPLAE